MNRFGWISCCTVLLVIASPWGIAAAQFSGDEEKSDRDSSAKAALKAAVELAEDMMRVPQDVSTAAANDYCKCVDEADSSVVDKIEQALDGPLHSTGLDFTETPLEEVVNLLQDDYGIPIQLDTTALDEIGLDSTEPITMNVHNISFQSALRLMLKQIQLTYVIGDEVLLITTPEEAESNLKLCVYDIRGLIETDKPKALRALVDSIVSCINTETWAVNGGGEAEIRPLPPNMLVITQTQAVHEEIRGFFDTIRAVRRSGEGAAPEPELAE